MAQTFSSFLKTRWVLLTVVIVFICFKIPELHNPFYCDEGWVYAPAVKTMAVDGPGLLPGGLPVKYSRGHPLFFHFLCAIWIRCAGASNIAVHSFPLSLSVIFLIALYECCCRLFDRRTAIFALLLVSTQIMFFVQASFVYPEVLVGLLTFLSLYFYSKDSLLLTSAMLAMLFFTKEGGLVFGAVIGCDALISLVRGKDNFRRRLLRLGAVVAPALLIGFFFVIQKVRSGWYLLPEHAGMIRTDWNSIYFMFRRVLYWTFRGERACYVLVFFIILLSIVPAMRRRNVRYLFLCLPAAIVYIIADTFGTNSSGSVLWVAMLLLSFAAAVYFVLRLNVAMKAEANKFIVLLATGVMAFLFYSALTEVAYRYLLVAVVLVLVFLAVCLSTFVAAGGGRLFYVAITGILLVCVYAVFSDEGNNDTDIEAFHAMNVQLKEVAYLEQANAYDKEIAIGCSIGNKYTLQIH